MKIGRLEVYTGGMFAEKSTNLQRQGKRHMLAGKKVIFLKPAIDDRYGNEWVTTHDGQSIKALNIVFDNFTNTVDSFQYFKEVQEADVVCIDEVQFFPEHMLQKIEYLINRGKKVYVAGLDMDKEGNPFGIMPYLMARAEHVEKFQAVCSDCGKDAWVSVETARKDGQVNIGNEYKPVCRSCSTKYIGGPIFDR
jgi:thymidine kinase